MQIRLKGTRARAASLGMCLFLTLASSEAVRAQAPPIYKVDVPIYKVDPSWPKLPLPNKWMMQGVPTMVVDKDDHVWVISRPRDITPDESGAGKTPPRNDCCVAAPAILEFDPQGNLLKSWGGPGYVPGWPAPGVDRPGPQSEHAIVVDKAGNVWLSGAARGDSVQKIYQRREVPLGLRPSWNSPRAGAKGEGGRWCFSRFHPE